MKYRLLDLLKPVPGNGYLRVEEPTIKEVPFNDEIVEVKCKNYCAFKKCLVKGAAISANDCRKCFAHEVIGGTLVSETGERYPIVDGIPRMVSNQDLDWVKKNQDTFSLEWKMFRFGERNWGQDLEFRKEQWLKGLGVKVEDLQGKLIYDAGCGSGLLSMAMADSYGMEVVAVDLACGIERAYKHNTNPYVYFVQGSVLDPGPRSFHRSGTFFHSSEKVS